MIHGYVDEVMRAVTKRLGVLVPDPPPPPPMPKAKDQEQIKTEGIT